MADGGRIAVFRESAPGEARVAITPETVRKFLALGAHIAVERGAGARAAIADADYAAAGAQVADADATLRGTDIVPGIQDPIRWRWPG